MKRSILILFITFFAVTVWSPLALAIEDENLVLSPSASMKSFQDGPVPFDWGDGGDDGDGDLDPGATINPPGAETGAPISNAYGALILFSLAYGLFMRHRNSIKDKE